MTRRPSVGQLFRLRRGYGGPPKQEARRLVGAAAAVARAAIGAALLGTLAAPAVAQAPAPSTARLDETTPFQCWWRSDVGALRIGQVVTVTLTCAALERDDLTAVPDESRLTVAAIQTAPFEIVGGSHPPDLRTADRRVFEYRYQLRIIDADVIGRDVKLPPLSIPYRVESRVGAGATLAGRDLVHLMPQLVFRVVSQVPADATDIRDAGDASLATVDALRFRASAFRVATLLLAVLALVAGASAVPALVGRWRGGSARGPAGLSDAVVLRAAAGQLADVAARHPTGDFDAEAIAQAHQAVRVVAAGAAGLAVRQAPLAVGGVVPEGRLAVTGGWRRRRAAVTASATTDTIARALEALPAETSAVVRMRLESLRDALAVLSRAEYGAQPLADTSAVAEALQAARAAAVALAREHRWSWRAASPAPPAAERAR